MVKQFIAVCLWVSGFPLLAAAEADPWDDPAFVAAAIAAADAVEAEYNAQQQVLHAHDEIVGVFVPPAVVADPMVVAANLERAQAHSAAFPFAVQGRSFLCNIQKAWLKRWLHIFPAEYPLMHRVPSFGWTEIARLPDRDEYCEMCGKQSIHKVVVMENMAAPEEYRILRVGVDCAFFMALSQEHVYQIARDNDSPLS
jgi:hypothetical protein